MTYFNTSYFNKLACDKQHLEKLKLLTLFIFYY